MIVFKERIPTGRRDCPIDEEEEGMGIMGFHSVSRRSQIQEMVEMERQWGWESYGIPMGNPAANVGFPPGWCTYEVEAHGNPNRFPLGIPTPRHPCWWCGFETDGSVCMREHPDYNPGLAMAHRFVIPPPGDTLLLHEVD